MNRTVIKNGRRVKLQFSRREAPIKFIELESEWGREREID